MKGLRKKNCPMDCENVDTIMIADAYAVYYVSGIILSAFI